MTCRHDENATTKVARMTAFTDHTFAEASHPVAWCEAAHAMRGLGSPRTVRGGFARTAVVLPQPLYWRNKQWRKPK